LINAALEMLLLQSPPLFHFWGGRQQVGFVRPQVDLLNKCIAGLPSGAPRFAMETGAGISTLWLLNHGFDVVSFCLSQEVADRMNAFLMEYPEIRSQWNVTIGYSELTLPAHVLSARARQASLCLIDGGHGVQTVFADFVYLNYLLIDGGFLLVDDVQLPGPKLLNLLLQLNAGFSLYGATRKLQAYRTLPGRKRLLEGNQKPLAAKISEAFGVSNIQEPSKKPDDTCNSPDPE